MDFFFICTRTRIKIIIIRIILKKKYVCQWSKEFISKERISHITKEFLSKERVSIIQRASTELVKRARDSEERVQRRAAGSKGAGKKLAEDGTN